MSEELKQTNVNYESMDGGDFLAAVGMDARLWADAFEQINPPTDHGTMLGWFANAIMAGYDEANRRRNRPDNALIDTLVEALEEISNHGVSQSAAMNMPEEQWAWRCFHNLQREARKALAEAKKWRGE